MLLVLTFVFVESMHIFLHIIASFVKGCAKLLLFKPFLSKNLLLIRKPEIFERLSLTVLQRVQQWCGHIVNKEIEMFNINCISLLLRRCSCFSSGFCSCRCTGFSASTGSSFLFSRQ